MDTLTLKIIRCVKKDNAKTPEEFFHYLIEECGELSACRSTFLGNKNKKLKESSLEESVDIIITAIALYIKLGGTLSHLIEYANKKVDRWENRISNRE